MRTAIVVVAAVAALALAACRKPAPLSDKALIERGSYLATIGGCHDCHSPKVFADKGPEPDPKRLLSGHPSDAGLPPVPDGVLGPQQWGALTNAHLTAWAGPWGVSFAANLTPHESGMAGWTPETFILSMRSGKHVGVGRPILPPMPWFNYARMTDEDLRALFAYLQSLPAVANTVPEPQPPSAPAPAAPPA